MVCKSSILYCNIKIKSELQKENDGFWINVRLNFSLHTESHILTVYIYYSFSLTTSVILKSETHF